MRRRFLLIALRRPSLWPALLAAAWAFRPRGWHRRPPFLPVPSRAYLRWRMETAYGDPDAAPPVEELARFVAWSAEMRRRMRPRGRMPVGFGLVVIVVVVAFATWVNLKAGDIEAARDAAAAAGYPGLLLASAVSGFNVVWPVPVAFFYPFFIESGFEPAPTLATIALGMTAGDLLGYLVGDATRGLARRRLAAFRARAEALHARHRLLPPVLLFVYAGFVPLPNELLVIPMAFMRYSLPAVMTAVLLGNVVFNWLVALGVTWIFGAGG